MNVYVCFYHGDFTMVDDSAHPICPSCLRGALAEYAREIAGEGYSDPDGYCEGDRCDDDGSRNIYHTCTTCGQDYTYNHEGDCSDCATSYQIYLRDESDDGYGEE